MPRDNKSEDHKTMFSDETMFEFIFKAYFPRLLAFARKFIADKDTAEDIVQDVFLKVWLKRHEIEESTFKSYLFTLVRNDCLNHIKHQQIIDNHQTEVRDTSKEESVYYADFFSDPLHLTIFNEIQDEIEKVIQNLPDQTRKVFHLSRFEGKKNTEIAQMLNVSVRTIEKHNTKALEKLKAHLSSHYLFAIAVLDLLKEFKS